jgi:hypothetical protein
VHNSQSPLLSTASELLALSHAGYKLLRRLQKGRAYRVHGAWRFRGSHAFIHSATVLDLVAKGLAERVDIGGLPQVRVTPAGSSVKPAARPPKGKPHN